MWVTDGGIFEQDAALDLLPVDHLKEIAAVMPITGRGCGRFALWCKRMVSTETLLKCLGQSRRSVTSICCSSRLHRVHKIAVKTPPTGRFTSLLEAYHATGTVVEGPPEDDYGDDRRATVCKASQTVQCKARVTNSILHTVAYTRGRGARIPADQKQTTIRRVSSGADWRNNIEEALRLSGRRYADSDLA